MYHMNWHQQFPLHRQILNCLEFDGGGEIADVLNFLTCGWKFEVTHVIYNIFIQSYEKKYAISIKLFPKTNMQEMDNFFFTLNW